MAGLNWSEPTTTPPVPTSGTQRKGALARLSSGATHPAGRSRRRHQSRRHRQLHPALVPGFDAQWIAAISFVSDGEWSLTFTTEISHDEYDTFDQSEPSTDEPCRILSTRQPFGGSPCTKGHAAPTSSEHAACQPPSHLARR